MYTGHVIIIGNSLYLTHALHRHHARLSGHKARLGANYDPWTRGHELFIVFRVGLSFLI